MARTRRSARASRSRHKPRAGELRVANLLAALEGICPFRLAADWDNVGLLAGAPGWPADRVLLAIDLTDAVADEILRGRYQSAVIYHPPIFKGIRSITAAADAPTTRLAELLAARVSIIALHTALDAAVGGTNDVLLDLFKPVERRPLEPVMTSAQKFKLVVFAPAAEVPKLRRALSAAGAGQIGHYSECGFELAGRGSFRGDASTNPTIGRRERVEHIDENRVEMVVSAERVADVVRALYATHSYEEPAFDLYPLHELSDRGRVGLGRVGRLAKPTTGTVLVRALSRGVDLSAAQVVGRLRRRFTSVTTAAGAFSANSFRDPDSLVITGELKHHDVLALLRRGVTAVCVGHYASERPVLDALRARLAKALPICHTDVSRADTAPLRTIRLR